MTRTLTIGPFELSAPVALAPMAGITDGPFRAAAAAHGAPWLVSEMLGSREMIERPGRMPRARSMTIEGAPGSVQIAGATADDMSRAARIVADAGAAVIDINMGCPAKKVTSGWSGSALMRDPDHALRLVEATVRAADPVPVTLKMRLGWDDATLTGAEIARRAEDAGIVALAVHGRTRAQLYKGMADWSAVRAIVEAVSIPVLVNGDVACAASAKRALAASGADGVMIGRAARGAPWLVGQVADALSGRAPRAAPTGAALADLVAAQYEATLAHHGTQVGLRCMRKHLGWTLAGRPGGAALRAQLMREEDAAAVLRAIRGWDWPATEPEALAA